MIQYYIFRQDLCLPMIRIENDEGDEKSCLSLQRTLNYLTNLLPIFFIQLRLTLITHQTHDIE